MGRGVEKERGEKRKRISGRTRENERRRSGKM